MREIKKTILYSAISMVALSSAALQVNAEEIEDVEEVVVLGAPVYRDRTQSVSPELEYDTVFFQQFEPTSVGDMLKRTPGVGFSSDVGEYDSPQLRGLGSGYTQILINGRRVAGSSADRAVFVDRIPAEMVDRIQIVRSPSADQDSQGVGGTINIILKDGASLEGGGLRLGLLHFDGDEYRGSAALSYGAQSNDITWSASATFSERYVPKSKTEKTFDPATKNLQTIEFEEDVRDSDDISLSGGVTWQLDAKSSLALSTSYVNTKREENQDETAYEIEDGVRVLDGLARDEVEIKQDSLTVGSIYTKEIWQDSTWELTADYSRTEATEDADKFERDDFESVLDFDAIENTDISDEEIILGTSIGKDYSDSLHFKTGLETSLKQRDEIFTEYDVETDGVISGIDSLQTYSVEETRVDGYLLGEITFSESVILELGVRVENTGREIESELTKSDSSNTHINPSAHLSFDLGDAGTFRASLARTVRRPGFDQLTPTIVLDEPEDGDAKQGNPELDDEVSNGLDVGYEQRVMGRGIVGFNAFYREVSDVIEEAAAGVAPGGGLLYSFDNTGDGKVWGVELDMNFPVTENIGFFANATWMDSEIVDPFTGKVRTFRDQPEYIYNVGVSVNMPELDMSAGFSYQKQGDSLSVDLHREVTLEYDGNLEVFVEKRFENDYVLRLTGNNLLDAEKVERFTNYDGGSAEEILANHRAGNIDGLEEEVEGAGPVITLTLRKSF